MQYKHKATIPNELSHFLSEFVFTGISIKGDITRLQQSYDNVPAVQTTDLAAAIGISRNAKPLSDVVLWATGRSFEATNAVRMTQVDEKNGADLLPNKQAWTC